MEDEQLTDIVMSGQRLLANGDPDGARARYADSWAAATTAQHYYQACVIAHFMAHAHLEPEVQLMWHLRALDAANAAGDERVGAFYPSLYANIAEVNLRLGDIPQARAYIERARAHAHLLAADAYGESLRTLIERVSQATEQTDVI